MPLLSSLKLHKPEALSLPCTFTPLCRSTTMFKINQGEDLALFTWIAISGKNNICCSATSTAITSSTQKGLYADCKAQMVPSNVMSGVSRYFSSQMCISSTPGAPPGALLLIQNTKNSTWAQTCTAEERMGEPWKNPTLPKKSKATCACASMLRQPMLSSPSRASPGSQLNFWNSCRPKTPANQTFRSSIPSSHSVSPAQHTRVKTIGGSYGRHLKTNNYTTDDYKQQINSDHLRGSDPLSSEPHEAVTYCQL